MHAHFQFVNPAMNLKLRRGELRLTMGVFVCMCVRMLGVCDCVCLKRLACLYYSVDMYVGV